MECQLENETINGQSCNVTTSHHLSITCTVRDYYPRINVYFRHKSNILKSFTSAECNNTDWTLIKNVTIMAVPSDEPYICVASNIPGYDGREQTARIYVIVPLPDADSTSSDIITGISTQSSDRATNDLVRE